jgi:hypothetical protein
MTEDTHAFERALIRADIKAGNTEAAQKQLEALTKHERKIVAPHDDPYAPEQEPMPDDDRI